MASDYNDEVLTRPRFLRTLLALTMSGLLAGCGGGGGSSSGSGGESSSHQPTLSQFTPNYAANITLYHWPALPVRVYFASDVTVTPGGGSLTRVNDPILTGFNRWPNATSGVVGFTQVTDTTQARIAVSTVTIPDPTGRSKTGRTSVTSGAGNVLRTAAVQIYVWPDITVPELTLGQVETATHALGIGGHSPIATDVMFAQHDPNADVLPSARDLTTIKTVDCFLFPST